MPYTVKDIEDFQKYYDNVTIPIKAHPKAAITSRNKWMVENSDLVLVYMKNSHGGAYKAMRYAEKLNKRVINLAGGLKSINDHFSLTQGESISIPRLPCVRGAGNGVD